MQTPPEKSTARELTEQTISAGAGMVPLVGSPVAVAFAVATGWSYNRRMRAWLEDLAEAVNELQEAAEEPLTFDDLANDVFHRRRCQCIAKLQATSGRNFVPSVRSAALNGARRANGRRTDALLPAG
jgi:hypothetical protein